MMTFTAEPVQPGGERRLAAERGELLPGPDEHVLGQLVGRVGAGHAAREGEDARHVLLIEALERRRVARRRVGDVVGLRLGPGVRWCCDTPRSRRFGSVYSAWMDGPRKRLETDALRASSAG